MAINQTNSTQTMLDALLHFENSITTATPENTTIVNLAKNLTRSVAELNQHVTEKNYISTSVAKDVIKNNLREVVMLGRRLDEKQRKALLNLVEPIVAYIESNLKNYQELNENIRQMKRTMNQDRTEVKQALTEVKETIQALKGPGIR